MSTALIVLLLVFLVLVLLNVSISFAIGIASLAALVVNGITMQIMAQRVFAAVDAFTLLAVPLFIFCGDIMLTGSIGKKLIHLCRCLVGWIEGGIAYITILASMFFGAISGSALATTRTIGGTVYPELLRAKYKPEFAASLGAVGGTLGILIPPSIAFVVFGTQTGTSVVKLFAGGAIAGVFVGVMYMIAARLELAATPEKTEVVPRPTLREVGRAFADAIWALLAPVIILGGIYSGYFTATEAAVVAVVYCIVVETLVYREMKFKDFYRICTNSAASAAGLLFLVAVASLYSWLLSIEGVSRMINGLISSMGLSALGFLLIVNVIYLILGMLTDTTAIIILTAPILFPAAASLGIDPVRFGIITVVNLAFGLITPPFGLCLFTARLYSHQPVSSIIKNCRMFYVFGLIAIAVITYVPQVYMWVVR